MNKSTSNECVAQGAATWNERAEHMRIMKELEEVTYWDEVHHTTDEEWAMMSDLPASWSERKTKVLPEKEVLYILSRNNLEEIRYMFERYGRIIRNCVCLYQREYFSAEAQEINARRNNREELEIMFQSYGFCDDVQMIILTEWSKEDLLWYCNYHGFGTKGQQYIVEKWEHEHIMTYVRRHGFTSEGETALIERGNHNEIMTYIHFHGLHSDNIVTLFNRRNKDEIHELISATKYAFVKINEDLLLRPETSNEFDAYIQRFSLNQDTVIEMINELADYSIKSRLMRYAKLHKFTEASEKHMIAVADEEFFNYYITLYPICHNNHVELVENRYEEEVMAYVRRHGTLSYDAEKVFFAKASHESKKEYLEKRTCYGTKILNILFKVRPIDYEILTLAFLKCHKYLTKDEAFSTASRDEVIARISEEKELTTAEVVALFFRNESDLFEQYINTHEVKF